MFSSVVQPNSPNANIYTRLHHVFTQKYYTYSGDSFDCNCIHVELVDKMIRELKRGKAEGLDGLMGSWLNTWFLVIPLSVFC